MIAGLSYGAATGGSIAFPIRTGMRRGPDWRHDLLALVIECVHPDNLGPLPPSPWRVAIKGEQIGLGRVEEFYRVA